MAITVVQTASASTQGSEESSVSGAFSSPTTAGNTIVFCLTANSDSTAGGTSTFGTPSLGSYTSAQWITTATTGSGPTFQRAALYVYPDCPGGQTALGMSVSDAAGLGFIAYEIAGLQSSPVDVSTSGSGSSTAWSSGATGTTIQSHEIYIGAVSLPTNSSYTPPSTYTNTAVPVSESGSAGYRIVSSTGTATYNGTMTTSGNWAAVVATFKSTDVTTTVEWDTAGDYQWVSPITGPALVEAGGAGAGGNGSSTSRGGPGAGSGEYAAEPALQLIEGNTYNLTVGAGGQGATGGNTGVDGGDSFFQPNGLTVYANGGTASNGSWLAGLGGTGSTNTVHFDGGDGYTVPTGQSIGGGAGGSAGSTGAGGNSGGSTGGAAGTGGGAKGGNGGQSGANGSNGASPGAGGGGAGAAATNASSKKVSYQAIDSQSFYGSDATGSPNGTRISNGTIWQGGESASGGTYNGTQKSIIWFNKGDIESDFSGYTITAVTLWLTNTSTWYDSGATVEIQDYFLQNIPSSWDGSTGASVRNWSAKTGQGARPGWGLSTVVGDQFVTGSQWGFAIGPGNSSYNLNYYASFNGTPNSANGPVLTISGQTSSTGSTTAGDGADGFIRITYSPAQPVTTSATVLWNTRKTVSPAVTVKWSARALVSQFKPSSWSTYVTVKPSRVLSWHTLESVPPLHATMGWATVGRVGALVRPSWNTEKTTVLRKSMLWNTRVARDATVATSWSVFNNLVLHESFAWANLQQLKLLNQVRWDTETTYKATTPVTWNTQGIVIAASLKLPVTFEWNTLVAEPTFTAITWNTQATGVSVSATTLWVTNAYTLVSVPAPVRWNTIGHIRLTPRAAWNTTASFDAVSPTVDWNTLRLVPLTTRMSWGTLQRRNTSASLRWNTRRTGAASRNTSWATLTRVRAQQPAAWDAYATYPASVQLGWNTLSELIKLFLPVSWPTVGRVITSASFTWNDFDLVKATASSRWATGQTRHAVPRVSWNTLHVVTPAQQPVAWNTRKKLVEHPVVAWAIHRKVTTSIHTEWLIQHAIKASATVKWNDLPVPVYYEVSVTRGVRWNTVPPTPVSVPAGVAWETLSRVKDTRRVSWTTEALTPLSVAVRAAWAVSSRRNVKRTFRWDDLHAALPATRVLAWRTREKLSPKPVLAWATRTQVSSEAEVRWSDRRAVRVSAALAWDTAPQYPVKVRVDVSWETQRRVSVSRTCTWKDAGKNPVSVRCTAKWDTLKESRVSPVIGWNTLQGFSQDAVVSYATAGRVKKSARVSWNEIGVVTARHKVAWRSYVYTVTSATVKWNVGQPVPTYIPVAGRVPWQSAQ